MMTTFSRPIDHPVSLSDTKGKHHDEREITPFNKRTKSSSMSAVEDELLASLNELLRRQKNEEATIEGIAPSYFAPINQISASPKAIAPVQSAQISQLFNEMVDRLTYVNDKGIQQTTIELNSDNFSSSVFYGCKITITEYSTAPKIFNVQFAGTQSALAFFQPHAGSLLNALQNGHWDFGVHRLETELLSERKEQESQQEEEEGQ